MRDRPKVGEILIQAGIIDELQLASALSEQSRWGRRLGMTLIKLGMVQEGQLVRALARQFDLPVASLGGKKIAPEVIALIPAKVAHDHSVIPLFVKKDGHKEQLFLGMEEPSDLGILDDLAFRTGMSIRPVMVGPTEIGEAIDRYYTPRPGENATAAKTSRAPIAMPSAASKLAESLGDTLSETNLRRIQEDAAPARGVPTPAVPTPAPAAVSPAPVPAQATIPLAKVALVAPPAALEAPAAAAAPAPMPAAPNAPLGARGHEAAEEITSPVVAPVVKPATPVAGPAAPVAPAAPIAVAAPVAPVAPVAPMAPVAPVATAAPAAIAAPRPAAPPAEERVAIGALAGDVARAMEETERTRLVARAIAHLLIEKGILTLDELQARIEKVKGPRSES